MTTHRELVIGGLVSYGFDVRDIFMRAASYVDRILRGTHPADLPVQVPTKYELIINLKTAKTLGLDVPPRSWQGYRPSIYRRALPRLRDGLS